jgi:hypothetical protein
MGNIGCNEEVRDLQPNVQEQEENSGTVTASVVGMLVESKHDDLQ